MGKEKNQDHGGNIDPTLWMVTFGDLLMLLLTFFVMLLSMSSMDTRALKTIFSIFTGGVGVMEFSELTAIKPVTDDGDMLNLKQGHLSVLNALNTRLDRMANERSGVGIDSLDILDTFLGGNEEREGEGTLGDLEGLVRFSEDERGVVITFQANILFEEGGAEVKPAMYPLLDTIAKILGSVSNETLIMGHTDDRPMRSGRYRSNWELSLYRALNVHRYLVEEKGLPDERLLVGGYGDLRPKSSNDTEEGRGENRRVEIILKRT